MKNLRKIIIFCLVMLVLLNVCTAVGAPAQDASMREPAGVDPNLLSQISEQLSTIEPEKEMYGLENVDFGKLCLGYQIPVFEVQGNSLHPLDIDYYWLVEENIPVAFVLVFPFNNALGVTITTVGLSVLRPYYGKGCVLVYDKTTLSYVTDSGKYDLSKYPVNSQRSSFSEVQNGTLILQRIVESDQVKNANFVPQSIPVKSSMSYFTSTTSASLSVPIITQDIGTNYCWACCMASLIKFKTGKAYSGEEISLIEEAPLDALVGKDPVDVANRLEKYLGYRYSILGEVDMNYNTFLACLSAGDPIYCGAGTGTQPVHAVLLRGIYQNHMLSVMDPDLEVFDQNGHSVCMNRDYCSGQWQSASSGSTDEFAYANYVRGVTLQILVTAVPSYFSVSSSFNEDAQNTSALKDYQ